MPGRPPPPKFGPQNVGVGNQHMASTAIEVSLADEQLLNARQVAKKLGVSERWVRDHTTRRNPRIRGVKMGMLMR